jgi:hypothetical protein
LEAAHLTGISTLLNPQNVRQGIDLRAAEAKVMGKSLTDQRLEKQIETYGRDLDSDLARLTQELGLSGLLPGGADSKTAPDEELDQFINNTLAEINTSSGHIKASGHKSPAPPTHAPPTYAPPSYSSSAISTHAPAPAQRTAAIIDVGDMSEPSQGVPFGASATADGGDDSSGDDSDSDSGSEDSDEAGDAEPSASSSVDESALMANLAAELGISGAKPVPIAKIAAPAAAPPPPTSASAKSQAAAAMAQMRQETFTSTAFDRSQKTEELTEKLERIAQYKSQLEDEGVNVTSIPNLTAESPQKLIDDTLHTLRTKINQMRYSTLADEFIMGGVQAFEKFFDGTREIPLIGAKPDYTGYHNTVATKLHRMRFDTARAVSAVIEKHNVGAWGRFIIELLPSFLMYPSQQRRQTRAAGLDTDPELADARRALASIKNADEETATLMNT